MDSQLLYILALVFAFLVGAVLGSFACCQAWRIHYKVEDKKPLGKRSVCLYCGHRLTIAENIPVFSWLIQRGKCKKCGKKIGIAEIISELTLGLAFLGVTVVVWPKIIALDLSDVVDICTLGAIVILYLCLVILWILMIYDAKWGKLPTFLLAALNIMSGLSAALVFSTIALKGAFDTDAWPSLMNLAGAIAILAGTYLLLYVFSKEKLVGGGDWLLALGIALLLGHWWLALVALFLSNFLASIYGIIQKIRTGKSVVYFGPFLVIAFVVTFLLQSWLNSLLSL